MEADDFPPRLRTQSNAPVKRLLDDVAHDGPSNERVNAIVAGVVAATATSAARKLTWGKVAAAIGSTGLVGVLAVVALHAVERRAPTPTESVVSRSVVAVAASAQVAPEASATPIEPVPSMKPAQLRAVATTPRASSSADDSSMAIELQRLIAIRRRMLVKDPASALDGIDAYERDYPHGAFVPEAEAMAIEALDESGRTDEARARADDFIVRYDQSPQAARIRKLRERMNK